MTQEQNQEYLGSLRGLVEESGYVREPGLDTLQDIRDEYEDFQDEKDADPSEAALHFMASAGEIADASLDWESDRERFFRAARDALGAEKNRIGMIAERISTGDWWYEGVSETDLREAYENLDPSFHGVR